MGNGIKLDVGVVGAGERVVGAKFGTIGAKPETPATLQTVLVGATMQLGVGKVFTGADDVAATLRAGGLPALEKRGFTRSSPTDLTFTLGDANGAHQKLTFLPILSTFELTTVSTEKPFDGRATISGKAEFSVFEQLSAPQPNAAPKLPPEDKWQAGILDAAKLSIPGAFRHAAEICALASQPDFATKLQERGFKLMSAPGEDPTLFQAGDPMAAGQQISVETGYRVVLQTQAQGKQTQSQEYL